MWNHSSNLNAVKNAEKFYYWLAAALVLTLVAIIWSKITPVASSSSAREVFVAGMICDGKTDPFFPTRLDQPVSKPPLYHWTLCGLGKLLNAEPSPFLARLLNLISVIVTSCIAVWLLRESWVFYPLIFFMFYPVVDEGLDTKVDGFNLMVMYLGLLVIFKARSKAVFVAPLVGIALFASKGLFSIGSFVFVFFFVNVVRGEHSFSKAILISLLALIGGLIYPLVGLSDWSERWISFETFERFFGDEDINPSPAYYYLQKIIGYFPVNVGLFYALYKFRGLAPSSKVFALCAVTFLLFLSLSYGKRANYILPVLPLLSKTSADGFRFLIRDLSTSSLKSLTKIIVVTNTTITVLLGIMTAFAATGGTVGLHEVDVALTMIYNNHLLSSLVILFLAILSFISQTWVKFAFLTVAINILAVNLSQAIKFSKNQWDIYAQEIAKHCSAIGISKEPQDERLDVLALLLRDKIQNNLEPIEADCIVDLKNQDFRGFSILRDFGWFRVLTRTDRTKH